MRGFFSLDGPFNKWGGLLGDVIILSLMWVFFSIPVITMGASTSAMFFVTTRRISNREGYITGDFWLAFKANFKKATIIWMIILLVAWLIWFNLRNMEVVGAMAVIIFPAQIIILAEIALMSTFIFPMNARFDMGIKQLLKSSFFMANRHLLTSLTSLLLLASAVLSFFVVAPIAVFVAPGAYAILSSYMIMRIFKKYRPEMDKDPMLEIQEFEAARELERRRQRIEESALRRKSEDDAVVTEADAFWAIQEEDEEAVTNDTIFGDGSEGDKGDIWEQLRKAGDADKED